MMKNISRENPDIFNRIITETELADFMEYLIKTYSPSSNQKEVMEATADTGMMTPFFARIQNAVVEDSVNVYEDYNLRSIYRFQTEENYIPFDYDITYSRIFRYFPAHWHSDNFFQIYYSPLSTCKIHFTNEEFILKPGFIMIIAPDVIHATPCLKDDAVLEHFSIRASTFDKVFFEQLGKKSLLSHFFRKALNHEKNRTSYLVFDTEMDRDIANIIYTIRDEARQQLPYSSNMMNTLMTQMLITLLRRYEKTARMPYMDDIRWKPEFSQILSYIQNNYTTVTEAQLSDKFGYSTRQINRIVHYCLNMSYVELITFLRMQKAAEMLRVNGNSIEYISSALGYNNVSSFYRTFKKYYRITPAQYINQEII